MRVFPGEKNLRQIHLNQTPTELIGHANFCQNVLNER